MSSFHGESANWVTKNNDIIPYFTYLIHNNHYSKKTISYIIVY